MPNKFAITADVQFQAANAASLVRQLNQQLQGINVNVNTRIAPQSQRQLAQVNSSIARVGRTAKQSASELEGFGVAAAQSLRRFAGFTLIATSFFSIFRRIQESVGEAIAFQREVIKISQVTGESAKDTQKLANTVTQLGTSLGISSRKLLDVSQVLAQAGLTARETEVALKALAKTELAPTFDNLENTTEGAIAIMNQFKLQTEDLEGALGSLNSVAAKFAVESGDIVTAVRRTGGAFQAAGGELNELIALFTSVRQTTRESAETIATGFRTIFTRIQRGRTLNFLENLGIDLRTSEGLFVGPLEAVRRLNAALQELESTDPRFAQIVEELGGFRQVSKVIPLIKEFAIAEKALIVAQQGSDSLTKDAAKSQQALAIQLQKVREEFDALIRRMLDDKPFQSIIGVVLSLSRALIKLADSLRPISALLLGITAITGGRAALTIGQGFFGKLANFKKFASGGVVGGVGDQDSELAALTPGEFVINKKAVQRIGVGNLKKLNAVSSGVSRFNKGGLVGYNAGGLVQKQGLNIGITGLAVVPALLSTFNNLNSETKEIIEIFTQFGGLLLGFNVVLKETANLVGVRRQLDKLVAVKDTFEKPLKDAGVEVANIIKKNAVTNFEVNTAQSQSVAARQNLAARGSGLQQKINVHKIGAQLHQDKVNKELNIQALEQNALDVARSTGNISGAAKAQQNLFKSKKIEDNARRNVEFQQQLVSQAESELGGLFQTAKVADEVRNSSRQKQKIGQLEERQAKLNLDSRKREFDVINKQIGRQELMVNGLSTLNTAISIASAAAITFGQSLQKSGETQLKLGISGGRTEFQRGRAVSAAGSAAGTGAAIGTAIGGIIGLAGGPGGVVGGALVGNAIGTTLGAISGAIFGFSTSIAEADRILSQVQFDRDIDKVNKLLNSVANGTSTASTRLAEFLVSIETLERGLLEADLESKETRLAQISSSTVGINTFLNDLAKSSDNFKEFKVKARGAILTLSDFTKTPISETEGAFKSLIETTLKLTAFGEIQAESQKRQLELVREINRFTGSLKDSIDNLSTFNSALSQIEGFSTGRGKTTISDRSGILNRPETVTNPELFRSVVNQAANVFGGRANTIRDEILSGQEAISRLPDIFAAATQAGPFAEGGDFVDRLDDALRGIPDFIRLAVRSRAAEFIGPEAKDEKILKAFNDDFSGTSGKLIEGLLDQQTKFFSESLSIFNDQTRELISLYDKRLDIELKNIDRLNKVVDLQEQREEFAAGLTGGRVGLDASRAFDAQRQLNILGAGNAGLINRPSAIGDALRSSQERILNLNSELQTTGESSKRSKLLKAIDTEETKVTRLNLALEFLTDASARNAAAQRELEIAQSNRRTRLGIAGDFVFGDVGRRRELARSAIATRAIAGGASPTELPAELRGLAKSFLESLPEGVEFGFLGGKTADTVLREAVAAGLREAGFSKEDIESITKAGSREEKLAGLIKVGFDTAITAQNQIIIDGNNQQVRILDLIRVNTERFATELENNNTRSEITAVGGRLTDVRQQIGRAVESQLNVDILRNALSDLGITGSGQDQALNNIIRNRDIIGSLSPQLDQINILTRTTNDFNKAIKFGEGVFSKPEFGDFIVPQETRNEIQSIELGGLLSQLSVSTVPLDDDKITPEELSQIRANFIRNFGDFGQQIFQDVRSRVTAENGLIPIDQLKNFIFEKLKETNQDVLNKRQDVIGLAEGTASNIGVGLGQLGNLTANKRFIEALSALPENFDLSKLTEQTINLELQFSTLSSRLGVLNEQLNISPEFEVKPLGFNKGGTVPGRGSKDTVPAMLTPGEMVLDATTAKKAKSPNMLKKIIEFHRNFIRGTTTLGDMIFGKDDAQGMATGGQIRSRRARRQRILERRESRRNVFRTNALFPPAAPKTSLVGKEARAEFTSRLESIREREARKREALPTTGNIAKREGDKFKSFRASEAERISELKKRLSAASVVRNERNAELLKRFRGFNAGGSVSDTVPAMLTPGEFVLNKGAVSRIGVGNLTKANNKGRQGFAEGGIVGGGGNSSIGMSSDAVNAFNNFNSNINKLTQSMDNFPREVTMSVRHTVEVIHNGAEIFANMQDNIVKLVEATTNDSINRMIKTKFPDVGTVN